MAGCGRKMEVSVATRYSAKLITVRCGNTSPYGDPWLCDRCEKIYANVNWRREAELNGERYDDDY